MDEVNKDRESAEITPDAESTGNRKLDKRLETGVLQGDKGTETAQVWISAFLIATFGFLVYLGSFSIPLHGGDLRLLHESTALHRIVTAPGALEQMPTAPLSAIGIAASLTLIGDRVDGLHAVSILLHLCCAVLVFLVARRLLPKGTPEALAMLSGLAFAAHPALTETVNYLNAFPVLQSSFFGLAALLLLLRGASQANFCVASLSGAVLCFALAFGSDTSTLLLALLGVGLLQLTPSATDGGRLFRQAALPVLVVTMAALWVAGRAAGILEAPVVTVGPLARLMAFVGVCGKVFISAVWPFGQTVLPTPGGLLPGLLLIAGGGAAIVVGFRSRAPLAQAGLWLLVSAFGIACYGPVDLIGTTRYVYFPLAALAVLLPWALLQIRQPAVYRAACGAAAVLVLLLGVLSFQRTDAWKSPQEFWAAESERHPDRLEPKLELGRFLWARARVAPDADQQSQAYREAVTAWSAVLDREPEHREGMKYLGMIRFELGEFEEAEPMLASAAARAPEDAQLALYIAMLKERQARTTGDREAMAAALRSFRRASSLGELPPEARASYGMLSASMGDFETGIQALQAVIGGAADHPLAEPLKRFQAAAEQARALDQRAEAAARERPNSPEAVAMHAERLLMEGRTLPAFYLLQRAMDEAPGDDTIWALLGFVSARMAGADQFLAERGESRASRPAAWDQLAGRTAAGGQWEAAEAYLRFGLARTESTAIPEVKLAEMAMQLRQPPRATAFLEAAQQAHPDRPEPWLRLADMAIVAGETARAASLIDGAASRGAAPEEVQALRERMGGQGGSPTGIQRTIIQ